MESERWQQIGRLYHAALERTEGQRESFLREACAGDEDLRREVESLLAQEGGADSFLERPAVEVAARALARVGSGATTTGLQAGQVISHYRLVEKLGGGGMGVVFKAEDTRLGRLVAVKFLTPRAVGAGLGPIALQREQPQGPPLHDRQALERFKREARAASALNHPNICVVHDFGEHDGQPFIVMELLEGRTLRRLLDAGPLKIDQLLDLAVQMADALAAAHAKGIIHRDIKPTNIFVTPRGEAKILDFGLAKLTSGGAAGTLAAEDARHKVGTPTARGATTTDPSSDDSLTTPGMALGTVAYMSPEQARGEKLDVRTDLFSLGSVLYEMATQQQPFTGGTGADVLAAILTQAPRAPRELHPEMPAGLERIILTALEKDRDLRYQSAAELRADLKRLRRDTSSGQTLGMAGTRWPVGREGAIARTLFALRRRWWIAAIGALVAAVLFVYAGLRPLPSPRVTLYRQITSDGYSKEIAGTDGARLYFTEISGAGNWIAQMATSGGEVVRVPTPSPFFRLWDVSPDGSSLLTGEVTTYAQGPLWTLPILGGSPYRIGDLVASAAAWSPDGQHIAYAQQGDLFLAQNDGSGTRKLASVQGKILMPAWSPDGKRIRFTAFNEPKQSLTLREVSPEGTNAHSLFPGWHNPPHECCGRWALNGRYFVFASQGAIWALAEPRGLLRRAAPQPVRLTSGAVPFSQALPSKDGKQLFAVGVAPRGEVVRYDSQSKQFSPFLGGISAEFVTFSRDGQWVAYVTYPDGALWRSKPDGSNRLQLTQSLVDSSRGTFLAMGLTSNSYVLNPHWSPDGREIAYTSQAPGQLPRIYRVSASGGQPQELLSSLNQAKTDPNWSPNGKRICFSGPSGTSPLPSPNIHILDLEDQTATDVPESNGFFSARWSPDGHYLAGLSLDSSKLALFDFSTQKWEEVVEGAFFSFPCWSHDGRYVYYLQGVSNPAVMRFRIADRKAERVADLKDFHSAGFYGTSLGLTPADQPVMTRNIGTQEIFALDWQAP